MSALGWLNVTEGKFQNLRTITTAAVLVLYMAKFSVIMLLVNCSHFCVTRLLIQ